MLLKLKSNQFVFRITLFARKSDHINLCSINENYRSLSLSSTCNFNGLLHDCSCFLLTVFIKLTREHDGTFTMHQSVKYLFLLIVTMETMMWCIETPHLLITFRLPKHTTLAATQFMHYAVLQVAYYLTALVYHTPKPSKMKLNISNGNISAQSVYGTAKVLHDPSNWLKSIWFHLL